MTDPERYRLGVELATVAAMLTGEQAEIVSRAALVIQTHRLVPDRLAQIRALPGWRTMRPSRLALLLDISPQRASELLAKAKKTP